MVPILDKRYSRVVIVIGGCLSLCGCYYMQAARGQFELMHKRQPIETVIQASATPAELASRLELVQEARRFSINELHLPDNDSYRSYADLERDYVVWNVFAAGEFSLQPKSWCFPVAGCVNYRGYFAEQQARSKARQLEKDGFDVTVSGVAAYSTLGKFNDPVLNTMMHWQETDLIAVVFHELAHQQLYVKGDSGFNESFATAVEEFAMQRWLSSRSEQAKLAAYQDGRQLCRRLMLHVARAREDLEEVYTSPLDVEAMRTAKQDRLEQLRGELSEEFAALGKPVPSWVSSALNNARLVSMSLYEGRLAEFRALLAKCEGDLNCFYDASRALAKRG